MLVLDWNTNELARFKGFDKAVLRSVSRAGSDTIRAMRAEANRYIRARKRIRLSALKKSLTLKFPKMRNDINQLIWELRISRAPIRMRDYPHRQVKKGVSVEINKGKRQIIKGAFVATMPNGHKGVFTRAGPGAPRLPIKELFSSRISDVMEDTGAIPRAYEHGQRVFRSAFERLMRAEANKASGR